MEASFTVSISPFSAAFVELSIFGSSSSCFRISAERDETERKWGFE